MKVRQQGAQCPRSIPFSVRRYVHQITHGVSDDFPGQWTESVRAIAGKHLTQHDATARNRPGKCRETSVRSPHFCHRWMGTSACCPRNTHKPDCTISASSPQPGRDCIQTTAAHSSNLDQLRLPYAAADSLPSATVHLHTSSTESLCPREIRRLGSFPSANHRKPRNIPGRDLSTVIPCK